MASLATQPPSLHQNSPILGDKPHEPIIGTFCGTATASSLACLLPLAFFPPHHPLRKVCTEFSHGYFQGTKTIVEHFGEGEVLERRSYISASKPSMEIGPCELPTSTRVRSNLDKIEALNKLSACLTIRRGQAPSSATFIHRKGVRISKRG